MSAAALASAATPVLRRILCVDDERDILDVIYMCLNLVGGYEVLSCATGQEAIDRAATFAPDMILLDVMMPQMNGPETLAALRRQPALASVPIIFMTARSQASEVKAYLRLGVVAVIPKPFDPMHLAAEVATIWTVCHDK